MQGVSSTLKTATSFHSSLHTQPVSPGHITQNIGADEVTRIT